MKRDEERRRETKRDKVRQRGTKRDEERRRERKIEEERERERDRMPSVFMIDHFLCSRIIKMRKDKKMRWINISD